LNNDDYKNQVNLLGYSKLLSNLAQDLYGEWVTFMHHVLPDSKVSYKKDIFNIAT